MEAYHIGKGYVMTMKCDVCKVIGFSLEELLPDGLCNMCKYKEVMKK